MDELVLKTTFFVYPVFLLIVLFMNINLKEKTIRLSKENKQLKQTLQEIQSGE